jgi:hypothetical protein
MDFAIIGRHSKPRTDRYERQIALRFVEFPTGPFDFDRVHCASFRLFRAKLVGCPVQGSEDGPLRLASLADHLQKSLTKFTCAQEAGSRKVSGRRLLALQFNSCGGRSSIPIAFDMSQQLEFSCPSTP